MKTTFLNFTRNPAAWMVAGLGLVILTGCQTPDGRPNRTGSGALLGGALGAATGAVIGNQSKHAAEGALIGGAVGALAGGAIGNSMDREQPPPPPTPPSPAPARPPPPLAPAQPPTGAPQRSPVPPSPPLSPMDIKAMSQAGISDEVIISQIHQSRAVYRLTARDIIDLHEAGVSQRVIDVMVNTPSTYAGPPPPRR